MKDFIRRVFRRDNILILLLVVSAFLGLVGVPQNIGITSDQIVLALLGVLALDMLSERLGYLDRIEAQLVHLGKKIEPRMSADDLLHGNNEVPSFDVWLQQSDEVWVAGKVLIRLLTNYGRQIQKAAESGKRFRFLMVNPDNSSLIRIMATSSFSTPTSSAIERQLQEAVAHFDRILKSTPKDTVEVRLADYIPPHVYWIADGTKPHGRMIVEMFGYKISTGERFNMYLTKSTDNRTYNFHLEQFERMWQDAKPLPDQLSS